MKNITFAVEDEVLDKVRVVAAQRKTTVNALVREFLTEIATRDERREKARRELLELAKRSTARMRPEARFDRESTYDE